MQIMIGRFRAEGPPRDGGVARLAEVRRQRRPESFFQELADRIRSVPGELALRVTRLAQVLRIWHRLRSGTEGHSSMIRHEIKDFRGLSYSARFLRKRRTMRLALICGLVIALCLGATIARADSPPLKNGGLIKGRFVGATDTEIKIPSRFVDAILQDHLT